ncbi:MAG: hypothetical protein ABSH48_27695 [Verrucomicrobiota bacterium]|jgi:hypothetical protein
MKIVLRPFSIAAVAIVALLSSGGAGCQKQVSAPQHPATVQDGVAQLKAALATASPVIQSNLTHGVGYNIRYGDYSSALLALQQIGGDPSLNDQQKKAVNDLSDLVKQAQNAGSPAH